MCIRPLDILRRPACAFARLGEFADLANARVVQRRAALQVSRDGLQARADRIDEIFRHLEPLTAKTSLDQFMGRAANDITVGRDATVDEGCAQPPT